MDTEKKTVGSPEIQDADFAFVQQDKSIHDVKFSTKPTTFFKDALKRFAKSKSSVAAAGILAVIILMAIIVPVADKNNISTDVNLPDGVTIYPSYLPPKWFDNAGGFLDGTGYVEDAICNPDTGMPDPSNYVLEAIVDGTYSTKEEKQSGDHSQILTYGKGGYYTVGNSSTLNDLDEFVCADMGLASSVFTLEKSKKLSYAVDLSSELYASKGHEESTSYLTVYFETSIGGETKDFTVFEKTSLRGLGKVEIPDLYHGLSEADYASLPDSVSGCLKLSITCDDIGGTRNKMYIPSIAASVENATEADKAAIANLSFDDAVSEYKKESAADTKSSAYAIYGGASKTLSDVTVLSASFRYDYYEAAYGEKEGIIIDANTLQEYVDAGMISWDWDTKTSTKTNTQQEVKEGDFTILDEEKCPIRNITSYKYTKKTMLGKEIVEKSVTVTISMYRYYAFKGLIASYEMPKFVFGTDSTSKDFFKIVFSGLLSSLGLGLLAATINIFIGLIWGAISGYFGGWTDILMERFTEILGGMPWIVLMTLIVLLLGSSFWTLLLALCLTGWIGVASLTRSQFYRFKGREYVLASRTLGASDARLIFQHILPNGIGTIVTSAVLMIPSVIFTEANISYLLPNLLNDNSGRVSFGITLSEAQSSIEHYPFLIVSASIVMVLIMIAFNLFGNGLRDAFNPSLKGADD